MTGIVYDGIQPSTGGPGGTLFEGKKFFIHRKCPGWSHLKTAVETNGGQVLPLENDADFVVADHARNVCPPGSISWRFIEDCLKQGKILDSREYIIKDATAQRPVGSGIPIKSTRRPFTAVEDAKFKEHMLQYLARGNTSGGNLVYQLYAGNHPAHTWQAWKDRWRKHLEPFLKQSEKGRTENAPERSFKSSTPSGLMSSRTTPQLSTVDTPIMEASAGENATDRHARQPFTPEDDQLIMDYVEEQKYYSKGLQGINVWSQFAESHPHHTDQSWRNRYIKVILPRMKQEGTGLYDSAMTAQIPGLNRGLEERSSPIAKREKSSDVLNHTEIVRDEMHHESHEADEDNIGEELDPGTFRVGLESYRAGRNLTPTLEIVVGDKTLDIWEFFRAVVHNHKDPDHRNWKAIAVNLGFDLSRQPRAPSLLEAEYARHLLEFEVEVSRFLDEDKVLLDATDSETEEQEDAATQTARPRPLQLEDQDGEMNSRAEKYVINSTDYLMGGDIEQDQQHDSDLDLSLEAVEQARLTEAGISSDMPSSPPLTKRKLNSLSKDAAYPSSSARKRVAIDRNRVIPSTPTHRLQPSAAGSHRCSPKSPGPKDEQGVPVTRGPETQDFCFETQVKLDPPGLGQDQTVISEGSSPSRQIRSELAQHTSPSRQQENITTAEHNARCAEDPYETLRPIRRALPASFTHRSQQVSPHSALSLRQIPSSSPAVPAGMPSLRPEPQERSPKCQLSASRSIFSPKPKKQSPAPRRRSSDNTRQSRELKPPTVGKQSKQIQGGPANSQAEDAATAAAGQQAAMQGISKLDQEIHDLIAIGYKEELVRKAMKAASYDVGVAKQALEPLMGGKPLPDDMKGLWTNQDDRDLKTAFKTDVGREPKSLEEAKAQHKARELRKRLKKKHGKEALRMRRGLWQTWGW